MLAQTTSTAADAGWFLDHAYLIAIISGWKTGPISAPVSIISYGTSLIQGVAYVILQVYAALFLLELAKRPDYRALRSWVLPIFGAHLFTLLVSIAQSALLLLIFLLAPPTSRTWLSIVGQVNSWLRLLVLAALLILWFQVFRLARRHRSAARAP